MTKPKKARAVREGPETNVRNYESQMQLLGVPYDYVKTLMLPEQNEPIRVPDEVVASSALFKSPQVVENIPYVGSWNPNTARTNIRQNEDPGESVVIQFPSIYGSILHTAGNDYVTNTTPRDIFLKPFLQEPVTMVQVPAGYSLAHALETNGHVCIPRMSSDGYMNYEIRSSFDTSIEVLRLMLASDEARKSSFQLDLRVSYRVVGNQNFVDIDQTVDVIRGQATYDIRGQGGLLEIDCLRFTILRDPSGSTDWAASLGNAFDVAAPPPTLIFPGYSACSYILRDIDQLTGMRLTSNERPCAVSGLVTWMGSTLQDGGNIAAARLPMGQCVNKAPLGDYYGFVSQLPVYAADFPLKDGAYVWWAPDSEQEYFFREYGKSRAVEIAETASLVFVMRRDEPTQTVRYRVDANFETQTRSAQYASLVGPTDSMFPKALAIAKTFPAVTINHTHENILTKAWNKAKGWMSNPSNWLNLLQRGVGFLLK